MTVEILRKQGKFPQSILLFLHLGQKDAQILDSVVQPWFGSEDLANIQDWQGYAKAQLTRSNVQPFSLATEKKDSDV